MDLIAARPARGPAVWVARLSVFVGAVLAVLALRHWIVQDLAAGPGGVSRAAEVLLLGSAMLCVLTAGLLARARGKVDDPAACDPATGLYRHAFAEAVLPQLLARDDRSGRSELAMVLLGVDYLDEIRRRYGAAGAERVLASVGRVLKGQARSADLPVRHDDRCLAVFLHCAEVDQAVAFARRIAMLLAAQQLDWRGDVIKVTACMGVALRLPGESLDELQARAAGRLQAAEAAGANRIQA